MSSSEGTKDHGKDKEQPAEGAKKKFPLVITLVVGLAMGGAGFMVPVLVPGLFGGGTDDHVAADGHGEAGEAEDDAHGTKPTKGAHSSGHGAPKKEEAGHGGGHGAPKKEEAGHGGGHGAAAAPSTAGHRSGISGKPSFLSFGQMIVNLNSDRMNRYLRMNLSLQVNDDDYDMVSEELEHRKLQLKSWLVAYLSDVGVDDVRGTAGQNRLRRDIQDHMNTILFEDGVDRIQDILFEEFTVQ
jgi:flagellar basal body-associated protein FliL